MAGTWLFIKVAHVTDGMRNRLEVLIRAFDPCLSCSTHVLGEQLLQAQAFYAAGAMIDERIQ